MTTPLERIARLRTDWAKATPAPWYDNDDDQIGGRCIGTEPVPASMDKGNYVASFVHDPDSALIVRLRNAAETQLDQLAGVFDRHWRDSPDPWLGETFHVCATCHKNWDSAPEGCDDYRDALAVLDKLDPPRGDQ